jgi:hypothetical protein
MQQRFSDSHLIRVDRSLFGYSSSSLIVTGRVKKNLLFKQLEGSLLGLQTPASGSYPEPGEFSPHSHIHVSTLLL